MFVLWWRDSAAVGCPQFTLIIWKALNLMIPLSFSQHRDTQETLAVLERLDLDTEKPTEDELARKFGYEESYLNGTVSWWQHLKPQMWSLFDEPYSSNAAKVKCRNGMEGVNSLNLTKHQQGRKKILSLQPSPMGKASQPPTHTLKIFWKTSHSYIA